jgi:UDP-2,3-diacylglucosamine hydrolase
LWYKDNLTQEVGATLVDQPLVKEWNGKRFFLHHGHALGNYDRGMKFLQAVFNNKFLQFMFERIHPETAFELAHAWSSHNRRKKVYESSNYLGDEKEFLLLYSKEVLDREHFDYFIYGHRHLALDMIIGKGSHYINLGNWITLSSYGVWDGQSFELKEYQ